MTTRVPAHMLGALAPSGSSDTAALQAALATGRDVLLAPAHTALSHGAIGWAGRLFLAPGDDR